MLFAARLALFTLLSTFSALALAQDAAAAQMQSSLTLDRSLIQIGMFSDGRLGPLDGKATSKTSYNNFINYCAMRKDLPLTNGLQVESGSCSATPQGFLAPKAKMPHAKFVFPFNTAVIPANTTFTVRLAIRNLKTGSFSNPDTNFHSAPQELTQDGEVVGHSHYVIQRIPSMESTTPLDPQDFVHFKGLNFPANDAQELTDDVEKGLDVGFYRVASVNAATNHQPVLVSVAQRGSLDDIVYFEVREGVPMPEPPKTEAPAPPPQRR
ncbi:hypothetical protein AURDEDRAFT_100624 [Auricularia subglabra TFB-10046 SS5]|nr:hypothetical protein AURDEDRAFT_100624 [Auricularia subglabra TFB-10046 SS5]